MKQTERVHGNVWRQGLLLLPLLIFLLLSFFALKRSSTSTWHQQCVRLAGQGNWKQLIALQTNLEHLGKFDTETLFWAAYGSNQLESTATAEHYAGDLLKTGYLNSALDRQLRPFLKNPDLRQKIALHRAVEIQTLLALLLAIIGIAVLYKTDVFPWLAALSGIGCLLLLL